MAHLVRSLVLPLLFVLAGCPVHTDRMGDGGGDDDASSGDDDTGDDDSTGDDDASADDDSTGDDDTAGDDDTTTATDLDGDGWAVGDGDCDDQDDTVFPGAAEVCDGIDDDCDGVIDDDCQTCDLRVPQDEASIQGAIDAAPDGATVCVGPGTWTETLDFLGKPVRVLGLYGPGETVIDASGAGPVVTFASGEGPDSALEDVTLTGGDAIRGGGIQLESTSPTLSGLVVRDNRAVGDGGGISCWGCVLTLTSSWLDGNSSESHGGGLLAAYSASVTLVNVRISGNEAADHSGGAEITGHSTAELRNVTFVGNSSGGWAGGISVEESSQGTLDHVAILGNTSGFGGAGLMVSHHATATLTHGVIVANEAAAPGGGVLVDTADLPSIRYTDLWGNVPDEVHGMPDPVGFEGNTSQDPEFLDMPAQDPAQWDLHLAAWAGLHDRGDPSAIDPDGSRADVGIYGGADADGWDRDRDGYPDWWLPGPYDPATSPGMDCDDLDPTVHADDGC